MILPALVSYAEYEGLGRTDGVESVSVRWGIFLDRSGQFNGTLRLFQEIKPNHVRPAIFSRPYVSPNHLTSGKKSHFLCDTLERVVLYLDDSSSKKEGTRRKQHSYFKGLLREAIGECPTESDYLYPVLNFLEDETGIGLCHADLRGQKAKAIHNATFFVAGTNLLELKKLRNYWLRRSKREMEEKEKGKPKRICLVSGKLTVALNTTDKIKGIPGTMAVGANLVSFDKEAFCSYGFEQAQNAPLSPYAELKIRSALTHLIKKSRQQKLIFNNTIYIHWTKQSLDWSPSEILLSGESCAAEHLLHSIQQGHADLSIDPNAYYALGLSGNGTRIIVRDWLESTIPQMAQNISEWFEDLSLVRLDGEHIKRNFKFREILYSLVRSDLRELSASASSTLFRGAFTGRSVYLSRAILASAVRRQLLDQQTKLNVARTALIKLCLIRSPNRNRGDAVTEQLTPENKDPAYLCGRLFAVFDRLQCLAQGELNSGIIERFYTSASTTPALVMGRLFRNAQFHLARVEWGIEANVCQDLNELSETLEGKFPQLLDLEGQGRFALGYYHQKAFYRRRSTERKKKYEEKKSYIPTLFHTTPKNL